MVPATSRFRSLAPGDPTSKIPRRLKCTDCTSRTLRFTLLLLRSSFKRGSRLVARLMLLVMLSLSPVRRTRSLSPLFNFSIFRFRLHVVDLDPSSVTSGGWLEDTSLVEKYTISEEAYNKREGTFRKYKEKLTPKTPSTVDAKIPDTHMEDPSAHIKFLIGCQ